MRYTVLVLLACLVIFLTGCAAMDSFFGVDPETGEKTGASTSDAIKTLAPAFGEYGLIGAEILGVASWFYLLIRGKKYKQAAISGVKGVAEVMKCVDDKKFTKEEIVKTLKEIQGEDGSRGTIKQILDKV